MGNKFTFILNYQDYKEKLSSGTTIEEDNKMYAEFKRQQTKLGFLIPEGLIHTHPIDKSVNVLKRKFTKLTIELGDDNEIFISGYMDNIGKYQPIITNLGYFISTATKNGEEWFNDFDDETIPIGICIEPKFDLVIKNIPNELYHVSHIRFKHKILKSGIVTKTLSRLSNHPNRIYLTDSLIKGKQFGKHLMLDDFEDKRERGESVELIPKGFCVYEINKNCISKIYSDINMRDGGFYILAPLGIKCFKLIYEET